MSGKSKYTKVPEEPKKFKAPEGSLMKYATNPEYEDNVKEAAFKIWLKRKRLDDVSQTLGLDPVLVRQWRMSQWWEKRYNLADMESLDRSDAKLERITEKTLDIMEDRLDQGDIYFDQKLGESVRVPVKLTTAAKVLEAAAKSKEVLREINSRVASSSMEDSLRELLSEFKKFSEAKDITGELVEGDGKEDQA